MPVTCSLRAVRPTARSMAWGPLGAGAVAIAVLVLVHRPWHGHGLSLGLARVVVVLAALGAAFALDDAAAVTLAPSPTSLLARRAVRLALALAGAIGVIVVASLVVVALGGAAGGVPLGRVALEAAGVLLLAMVLSAGLGGDAGAFTLAAGLLGAMAVQQRWPSWSLLPMAPGAPGWAGAGVAWAFVTVTSAAALLVLWRDPARRWIGPAGRRRSAAGQPPSARLASS